LRSISRGYRSCSGTQTANEEAPLEAGLSHSSPEVEGPRERPEGRIAPTELSRLAIKSDFDFSMGAFENKKPRRRGAEGPAPGAEIKRSRPLDIAGDESETMPIKTRSLGM
jgi:hypothetical protein